MYAPHRVLLPLLLVLTACGPEAPLQPPADAGVAPDTQLVQGPAAEVVSASSMTLHFAADVAGATFECSLDGAAYVACVSPHTYVGLADGAHAFGVRAVLAGQTDATPALASWAVDTTAPDARLLEGPSGTQASSSATFRFEAEDGSATFECSLDGAAFSACSSPKQYTALAQGAHTFAVRARDGVGNTDTSPATRSWTVDAPEFTRMRLMAANLTSGSGQSYDPGHGIRIFQGLDPDVVMIQEFNYGGNSATAIRGFVDTAFGADFSYYRESGTGIPNGVISRWPIVASGEWDDSRMTDRDFAWTRIDVPGPNDLWAVSVHLKASSGSTNAATREAQASQLVSFINANVPPGDFLVIGGDFNTYSRSESCVGTLSSVVITSAPYPVDQDGAPETNSGRTSPYDWVLVDGDLAPHSTAVVIGSNSFPSGLVFDSRVYTPLADVSPVLQTDSAEQYMQHMAVVRDFLLPN